MGDFVSEDAARAAGVTPDVPAWVLPEGAPPAPLLVSAQWLGVETMAGADGSTVHVLRLVGTVGETRFGLNAEMAARVREMLGGTRAPKLTIAAANDLPRL